MPDTPDVDIDRGDLRDKVAAPDPARAPLNTDSEAAGFADSEAVRAADAEQARIAQRAVPRLDPDRAVSPMEAADLDHCRRRHVRAAVIWTIVVLLVIIAVAAATLPQR